MGVVVATMRRRLPPPPRREPLELRVIWTRLSGGGQSIHTSGLSLFSSVFKGASHQPIADRIQHVNASVKP